MGKAVASTVLLAGVLVLTSVPTLALHESYFKAEGVATDGSGAWVLTVEYFPFGGESVRGYYRVVMKDAAGAVVSDRYFYGGIEQQGLDNDPIPETFVRHGFSLDGAVEFDYTGALWQYELTPTAFVHAYEGTYQGMTVAFVVLQADHHFV